MTWLKVCFFILGVLIGFWNVVSFVFLTDKKETKQKEVWKTVFKMDAIIFSIVCVCLAVNNFLCQKNNIDEKHYKLVFMSNLLNNQSSLANPLTQEFLKIIENGTQR